jgi:hypothetical protein
VRIIRRFFRFSLWELLALTSCFCAALAIALYAQRQPLLLKVTALSQAVVAVATVTAIGIGCGSKQGRRELYFAFAAATLIWNSFENTEAGFVNFVSMYVFVRYDAFILPVFQCFMSIGVGLLCGRLAYAVQD